MNLGDLSRINTNVQSMSALGQLNKTNSELGVRQMRLATGSRLNRAEDDSAGYTIANKLQAKTRGQAQALSNIGDAKGMLTVGEGALNSTMDILQTMKEKAVQAANDTMGTDERTAIQNQLDALTAEIDDVLGGAEFNGTKLFGGGAADDSDSDATTLNLNFQVGASNADGFGVSINALDAEGLGVKSTIDTAASAGTADTTAGTNYTAWGAGAITADGSGYTGESGTLYFQYDETNDDLLVSDADDFSTPLETIDMGGYADGDDIALSNGLTMSFATNPTTGDDGEGFSIAMTAAVTSGGVDVTDSTTAQSAITTIDAAIATVNDAVSGLGDSQARLTIKQDNLDTSMTNYEAARSRIQDTDFAKEQMEIVKLQILQQTGIGSLAQANSGPQSVLSLIG